MDKYEEVAKKIRGKIGGSIDGPDWDYTFLGIADILREAFPEPSDNPQVEANDDDLDITTINKIDKIFHGLTDHGDPMIRMSQARAVMAKHDAQLLAVRPAPTAEKALREAAQRVADKYCDLMDEDGGACSEDCECWHSHGGGCDGSSAIYRAAREQ